MRPSLFLPRNVEAGALTHSSRLGVPLLPCRNVISAQRKEIVARFSNATRHDHHQQQRQRLCPLLTRRRRSSSSPLSSPSRFPSPPPPPPPVPSSLPPAASELLSAAFSPASPGIVPALAVNAVVFTLGAKVLAAGLEPRAVAASFALGTLSFAAFGWRGYSVVCGYFVAGSAVTRLRLEQKQREGIAEARGGRREIGSVVGSGLAGALAAAAALALATSSSSSPAKHRYYLVCATAFVASFASKLADTVSSEVGKAFGTKAYLSTTLAPVPRGTEGAVSLEGSAAGLAAAAAVALYASSLPFLGVGLVPARAALAAAGAAVAANVFESWLGATAQSGKKSALLNLSNDAVNAVQICVAAAIAAAAVLVFGLV